MATFGYRLKLAREAKGLSQADLAKMMGLKSQGAVSNWESEVSKPDLDKFVQICDILGVTPYDLLDFKITAFSGQPIMKNTPEQKVSHANSYTIDERDVLSKLDDLDEQGYQATIRFLNEQHERVMNRGPNSYLSQQRVDPLYAWVNEDPPFLKSMLPKCKEIRHLMKETRTTAEDIAKHLWRIGYGGEICLFTILCIVREKMVPNIELAENILDYLNMNKQLQEKHR